jgi:putative phosphoesterase
MRLALISDVHANVVALRAVLNDIGSRGVAHIISAGDVVGYYPYPNETIALFQEHDIASIQGNHDRAVLNVRGDGMNLAASSAVLWTADQLTSQSKAFLASLPSSLIMELDGTITAVFHGAPFDPDHYIFEDEVEEDLLRQAGCDLLVLGHTHVPYIRRFAHGTIINPGSVGQPRDGDPDSCYALYDTEKRRAVYLRVPYDIEEVAIRSRDEGLPEALAQRLYRGR